MQGLGFFDGFWRDLVIDGNTIIVDHWHGIAVFGARDSVIRNNVVRYKRSPSPELTHNGPKNTWIKVGPHKDGRPSERVVIENNEAAHYDIDGKDMVFRNNRHN